MKLQRWEAAALFLGLLSVVLTVVLNVFFSPKEPSVAQTLKLSIPLDVALVDLVGLSWFMAKRRDVRSRDVYNSLFRWSTLREAIRALAGGSHRTSTTTNSKSNSNSK